VTFADRLTAKLHLLCARCPRCLALNSADPSMRVLSTCLKCHAVLMPRREVVGITFVEHGRIMVTS